MSRYVFLARSILCISNIDVTTSALEKKIYIIIAKKIKKKNELKMKRNNNFLITTRIYLRYLGMEQT